MTGISLNLGTFEREGQIQKYYIFLNLGPAACPAQANITDLQLPMIETRTEVLLELARADTFNPKTTYALTIFDRISPSLSQT
jgi:hypothetical protein